MTADGTWATTRAWLMEQRGVSEEGRTNRNPYAAMAGHRNGQEWCATFVSAAMRMNGVPTLAPILVPSSRTMFSEAKRNGQYIPMKNVTAGDVVHLTRGVLSLWKGHVGIVLEVLPNGRLKTIEGNTNAKGSATGGSVLIHDRPETDWNLGAWRPRYKIAAPVVAAKVTLWALPDGAIVRVREGAAPKLLDGPTVHALLAAGAQIVSHPAVAYDR